MKKSNRARFLWCAVLAGVALGAADSIAAAAKSDAAEPMPIFPTKPIVLFNGKDLSNFYTHLVDYKYKYPNRVFTVVEAVDGCTLTSGKLLLQSEGAEIFFRRIELHPVR